MWLTVSEDPHGRIRYHYDDLYSGRSGLFRDFSAPSLSRGCSNFPTYERYSGPSIQKQLEREEYDNVHPDSPIPHYSSRDNYYGYSCSPGTSSSSNYEEEYAPSTKLEERKTSRFLGPSPKKSYYPEPSRLYSVDMLSNRSGYFEQSKADQMRKQPLTKSASNTDFRLHFAEKSRIFPEDQMQFADIRLCSEYHSRPPVVPSPDYSPPQNRVRFLDEELRQSDYSTNTRGSSTVAIEALGIESRRAESRRRSGVYRTRAQLQTSASEVTLNQRHTVKTRRGSVQSEGLEAKRISLKQYGQIIKDRLFSSVAIREQRSVAPANSVFSMGTPDSPFSNGVTPLGAAVAVPKPEKKQSSSSFFTGKKKKDKKPKIRKEDISNPTNFQHKAHVGWNQDSGFSNNVDSDPMDESIKNIIRAAGQDPNNLSKKTIKFVYDFIERYEEKATPEPPPQFSGRHQAPPPPIPLSQPISQWSAPPPPPSRNASYQGGPPSRPPPPPPGGSKFNARPLPQVPNTVSDLYRPTGVPPPPPPPPPSFTAPISSNAPPAPPPPPPMMASAGPAPPPPPPTLSNMPPPQSGRGNLLAEIQAGKQLRSVGIVEKKTSTNMDARGDVMAQIRQGAQLKHVDPTEQANRRSVSALTDMGGIAGALAKALEERRNNMQLDDSSDDDDNSDEKNEWSD